MTVRWSVVERGLRWVSLTVEHWAEMKVVCLDCTMVGSKVFCSAEMMADVRAS